MTRKSGHHPTLATRGFPRCLSDLDLALTTGGRAERVTRLLQACLPDSGDNVWQWSLHRRLQALLAIELESRGPCIMLAARCQNAACGESLELELDVSAFALGDRPDSTPWHDGQGARLTLRTPRGDDQRVWETSAAAPSATQMARALLSAADGSPLHPDVELSDASLKALSQQLDPLDPLTALTVGAVCPACGRTTEVEVDLEGLLLARAAQRQRELFDVVHRIAGAYHWSEDLILSLSPRRRAQYLQRIERDLPP